ncbi:MAG: alanine racemase [Truepera sp.]|nr:alanine racemase [Truepera sp.]
MSEPTHGLPPSWRVGRPVEELETPCPIVDIAVMERNLQGMAEAAARHGVKLRPHIKTHKIPDLARRQLAAGAVGIATAKLSEAELMAEAGLNDILVAYQPVGETKVRRLVALAQKGVQIACTVDAASAAQAISRAAKLAGVEVALYIEVNINDPSGKSGRTGIAPASVPPLARELTSLPNVRFTGILGYRGVPWLYSSELRNYGPDDLQATADEEARMLVELAEVVRASGLPVPEVVAGSTPTAKLVLRTPGITEVQPGEYIFYGGTHVGPGVCGLADCALSIRATIASLPTPGRAVLDAGSKVLSGDIKPSLMPNLRLEGMGIVRDGDSLRPLEGAVLTTLSEEHGVIEYDPGCGPELNLGQVVDVVPVHVCTTVNLATALVAVRDGVVAEVWPVAASGCVW